MMETAKDLVVILISIAVLTFLLLLWLIIWTIHRQKPHLSDKGGEEKSEPEESELAA